MTALSQILAVTKGTKARVEKATTELHHQTQVESRYTGFTKEYHDWREGAQSLPGQRQLVQVNIEDVLGEAAEHWIRLADVLATQEEANTRAKADVIVGGQILLAQVPAANLLALDHILDETRKFIEKLPVLDPAQTWSADSASGVWKSDEIKTHRTEKVLKVLVKYEATDKHPAQTEPYSIDEPVGEWTTIKFSSALPAKRKRELLDRITKLIDAVKVAKEEAAKIEIVQQQQGQAIYDYLLA